LTTPSRWQTCPVGNPGHVSRLIAVLLALGMVLPASSASAAPTASKSAVSKRAKRPVKRPAPVVVRKTVKPTKRMKPVKVPAAGEARKPKKGPAQSPVKPAAPTAPPAVQPGQLASPEPSLPIGPPLPPPTPYSPAPRRDVGLGGELASTTAIERPHGRWAFVGAGVLLAGGLGMGFYAQGEAKRATTLGSAREAKKVSDGAQAWATTANLTYGLAGAALIYGLLLELLPPTQAEKISLNFNF